MVERMGREWGENGEREMEGGVEGGPGSPDYTVIMAPVSERPNNLL
jgi:hypothetical protein